MTPIEEGLIRGFLNAPETPNGNGIVLTHGAGANCQTSLLFAGADAFSNAGYAVLRCDLPFRQTRAHGPPFPGSAKRDQLALREAAAFMRRICSGKIILGGHSYGGRQATLLLAEDSSVADLLLLFSYPLHPPKKPDQLRTEHFPSLKTPSIFIHGSRDQFGTPAEMQSALRLMPVKTELVIVDGAAHELKNGKFEWRDIVIERVSRRLAD